MALTLVTPMTVETKAKTPKLNKSKLTLTITEKKTKPTVQLKVKTQLREPNGKLLIKRSPLFLKRAK
jgi:hypothetical protein